MASPYNWLIAPTGSGWSRQSGAAAPSLRHSGARRDGSWSPQAHRSAAERRQYSGVVPRVAQGDAVILKAGRLLQFGQLSIGRIAWPVDHADSGAFRKVHWRIVGLSAGECRPWFHSSGNRTGRHRNFRQTWVFAAPIRGTFVAGRCRLDGGAWMVWGWLCSPTVVWGGLRNKAQLLPKIHLHC